MSTKLSNLSEISLGTILTRVKPKSELQPVKQISTISMQELSNICGKDDSSFDEIISKIDIEKVDKCLLTKENDIVIGLSSQMAMVITKKRANCLLLSNFCLVRINDTNLLDPYYFAWLFNENSIMKHQLTSIMQGQSYVKMITLDVIRDLELDLPSINKQILIGKIYYQSIQKSRYERRLIELKQLLLNKKLENIL